MTTNEYFGSEPPHFPFLSADIFWFGRSASSRPGRADFRSTERKAESRLAATSAATRRAWP